MHNPATTLAVYEVWIAGKAYPVSAHHDANSAFLAGQALGCHFTLRLFTGRVIFNTERTVN